MRGSVVQRPLYIRIAWLSVLATRVLADAPQQRAVGRLESQMRGAEVRCRTGTGGWPSSGLAIGDWETEPEEVDVRKLDVC